MSRRSQHARTLAAATNAGRQQQRRHRLATARKLFDDAENDNDNDVDSENNSGAENDSGAAGEPQTRAQSMLQTAAQSAGLVLKTAESVSGVSWRILRPVSTTAAAVAFAFGPARENASAASSSTSSSAPERPGALRNPPLVFPESPTGPNLRLESPHGGHERRIQDALKDCRVIVAALAGIARKYNIRVLLEQHKKFARRPEVFDAERSTLWRRFEELRARPESEFEIIAEARARLSPLDNIEEYLPPAIVDTRSGVMSLFYQLSADKHVRPSGPEPIPRTAPENRVGSVPENIPGTVSWTSPGLLPETVLSTVLARMPVPPSAATAGRVPFAANAAGLPHELGSAAFPPPFPGILRAGGSRRRPTPPRY